MTPWYLRSAVNIVLRGGIIAYPTEGVWGLGCNPYDVNAVQKLLHIKQRKASMGLILVAATFDQVAPFLDPISDAQYRLIMTDSAPPTTWLLPASPCPAYLRGDHSTLAIRISNHPTITTLCQALQRPLISTSANPHGRPPARSALQVRRYFGSQLALIVSGSLGNLSGPTPIRDVTTGGYIRR